MLVRAVVLALLPVLSACGRLSFDPAGGAGNDALPGDGAAAGHDEDGDGVPDVVDTCPHLAGAQTDGDGDGIGDLCDPHPAENRDSRVLFSTFSAGDQPFTLGSGDWMIIGDDLVQTLTFADLGFELPTAVDSIQIELGLSVDMIDAGATEQRQFAVHAEQDISTEQFYGELNELPADISLFDIQHYTPPSSYTPATSQPLDSGIHTGELAVTLTKDLTIQTATFRGGWGSETYQVQAADSLYTGARQIYINMNGIAVHLHYIFATTWTP